MGSLNLDGTHISQSHRVSKARPRHVLVTDHTDDTTKKRIELFDPSKLDLALWMDASDISTFTVSSFGRLTEWRDKVNGTAFVLGGNGNLDFPPISSKLNGLHCPLFNQFDLSSGASSVSPVRGGMEAAGTNPMGPTFTMLLVARAKEGQFGLPFCFSEQGNAALTAGLHPGPTNVRWFVSSGGQEQAQFGVSAVIGETNIFAAVERGSSRDLWIDGALKAVNSVARNMGPMDSMEIGTFRLRQDTAALSYNGWIAEIIFINKDLPATPAGLETYRALHRYLANKWGVSENLDANML